MLPAQLAGGLSMALTLYYGSGSPFAWRVWLALEYKALSYDLKVLSFDRREHKTADYLTLNPRGEVPVLVDDGFALYESHAKIGRASWRDRVCQSMKSSVVAG